MGNEVEELRALISLLKEESVAEERRLKKLMSARHSSDRVSTNGHVDASPEKLAPTTIPRTRGEAVQLATHAIAGEELVRRGHDIEELLEIKGRILTAIEFLRTKLSNADLDRYLGETLEQVRLNQFAPPSFSAADAWRDRDMESISEVPSLICANESAPVLISANPLPDLASVSQLERNLATLPGVEDVFVRRVNGKTTLIELTLPRYAESTNGSQQP